MPPASSLICNEPTGNAIGDQLAVCVVTYSQMKAVEPEPTFPQVSLMLQRWRDPLAKESKKIYLPQTGSHVV